MSSSGGGPSNGRKKRSAMGKKQTQLQQQQQHQLQQHNDLTINGTNSNIGIILPSITNTQHSSYYPPSSTIVPSLNVRSSHIGTTNSFPSPLSSLTRSRGGGSSSRRRVPTGGLLKGLDATPPPRSEAATAARAQFVLSDTKGHATAANMFNPSPPTAPHTQPIVRTMHVHGQVQRKRPVKASFESTIAPSTTIGPSSPRTRVQTDEASKHASSNHSIHQPSIVSTSLAAVDNIRPDFDSESSFLEESKYGPSSSTSSSTARIVGTADPSISTVSSVRSPLPPSPSLYTAPPASLFALVATPDASQPSNGTNGPAGATSNETQRGTFAHIHSSNSDHGTASAVVSSHKLRGSTLSPTYPHFHHAGGRLVQHHHQSLSSTPLPIDVGENDLPKSPSPSEWIGTNKRHDPIVDDDSKPNVTSNEELHMDHTTTTITPHPTHLHESSTNPTHPSVLPQPSPPSVTINLIVQMHSTPSGTSSISTIQPPPDHAKPSDNESLRTLLPALLALLPAEDRLHLSTAGLSSASLTLGQVSTQRDMGVPASEDVEQGEVMLAPRTNTTTTTTTTSSSLDAATNVVDDTTHEYNIGLKKIESSSTSTMVDSDRTPRSSSPVLVTSNSAHVSTLPLSNGPRTNRAKSLFAPRPSSKPSSSSCATTTMSHHTIGSESVSPRTNGMSPISPTIGVGVGGSSHSRRSTRFLLPHHPPHPDLAELMSRKRVSFMSKSLHALASDEEEVDMLTHELLTNAVGVSGILSPRLGTSPTTKESLRHDAALLQASLDQDVLLADDDEFGLNVVEAHRLSASPISYGRSSHTPIASSSILPIDHVITDSPSRVSSSSAVSPVADSRGMPPSASTPRGGGGGGNGVVGDDAELWSINHSTLLLERLKLEPIDDVTNPNGKDVHIIYDKILNHLLRLKKMITRRHFKSRETLQRKLNTITKDLQVVDWISKEFLTTEQDETNILQASSTTRRATTGSPLTILASPMNRRSARSSITGTIGVRRQSQTTVMEESTQPSDSNQSTPTNTSNTMTNEQEGSNNDTMIVTPTKKKTPIKDATSNVDGTTMSSTVASASLDDATLMAVPSNWTSPFAYPLSPSMIEAIQARSTPRLSTIESLLHTSSELHDLLETVSTNWNFDIFEFNSLSYYHPILTMGMYIFQTHSILRPYLQEQDIQMVKIFNFLVEIEKGYQWKNPYHNAIHSADVVQNMLIFLSSELLTSILTPLDLLAGLIGAFIHDYMHIGQTNAYLIATQHELSLQFNDQSILENQSLMEVFRLLKSREDCNFLETLSSSDQQTFRQSVVSMVLHTDMRAHITQVNTFEQTVMKHRNSGTWFSTPNDRKLLLDFALHVADLGNPAKPLPIGLQWSSLIMNEYYHQGDMEREAGLTISPMMDRNRPTVDMQQFAFINVVVLPLFTQFREVLNCGILTKPIENLITNRAYYANRMEVAKLVQAQAMNMIKLKPTTTTNTTATTTTTTATVESLPSSASSHAQPSSESATADDDDVDATSTE